ncbi:hypothetical protein [Microcoleus sp. herbarium12]
MSLQFFIGFNAAIYYENSSICNTSNITLVTLVSGNVVRAKYDRPSM